MVKRFTAVNNTWLCRETFITYTWIFLLFKPPLPAQFIAKIKTASASIINQTFPRPGVMAHLCALWLKAKLMYTYFCRSASCAEVKVRHRAVITGICMLGNVKTSLFTMLKPNTSFIIAKLLLQPCALWNSVISPRTTRFSLLHRCFFFFLLPGECLCLWKCFLARVLILPSYVQVRQRFGVITDVLQLIQHE